jgi:hypothetical protein
MVAGVRERGPAIERLLWVVVAVLFVAAFVSAMDWKFAARLMPQTAAAAGVLFVGVACFAWWRSPAVAGGPSHGALTDSLRALPARLMFGRAAVQWLWLAGLLGGVALIGMLPALLIFMLASMIVLGRVRWRTALLIAVPLWLGMYVLFVMVLHLPWPDSLLGDAYPALRAATHRLI